MLSRRMLDTIDRRLEMALYLSIPLSTSGLPFRNDIELVPMDLHFHVKELYYDFFVEESSSNYFEIYNG